MIKNPGDYIVRDSSVYVNTDSFRLEDRSDATLKIGIVRDILQIDEEGVKDILYVVEVWLGGKYTPIQCSRTSRFGGVYNYEEFTYRGFTPDDTSASDGLMDFKPGDCVLVGCLMGDTREGVIISAYNHPGRKRVFTKDDDVVYESEFNGINKSINIDGEYTVTFKGQPQNLSDLSNKVDGTAIAEAEYDMSVGGSFYKFDKTGSFSISDNDGQEIFIDKSGKIVVTSGSTSLTIDKSASSYTIDNKDTTFKVSNKFAIQNKTTEIKSSSKVDIKSGKINTKGTLTQTGNSEFKGNVNVKGNTEISGQLSSQGPTSLAGGSFPLIHTIIVTIGQGNLGAPVFSNSVVLKTVLTKAT